MRRKSRTVYTTVLLQCLILHRQLRPPENSSRSTNFENPISLLYSFQFPSCQTKNGLSRSKGRRRSPFRYLCTHHTHSPSLSPPFSLRPPMASSAMKLSLFFFLLSSLTHARDSQFFNKIPTTTNNVVVPNNKESTTNQQQQEPNSLPENQNNNQQQQQPNSLPENQNNNQQQEQEPSFLPDTENSYGLYGHESNNNVVVPNNQQQQQQQQPNFLPNDWNSYGQYGHESGQNPPSTTTTAEFKQPDHKYLPKNYNPVAYVTQPDDINEETSFSTNPNNNNGAQNFNNQQQNGEGEAEEDQFRNYPTTTTNNRDNYYYNGGSSFNSHPQRQFTGGFEPQGMSDTRVVANGKYFYDLNSERFSNNHPYESLRAQNLYDTRNFYVNNADEASNRDFNNRNFYGNNENGFNGEGYQNFQNEENLP